MAHSRQRRISSVTWDAWQEAFQMFDIDHDGHISSVEIARVMERFDCFPTDSEVQDVIQDVDESYSGTINHEEFILLMDRKYREKEAATTLAEAEEEADLRAAFNLFDRDKSGFISIQEMKLALNALGESISETELRQIMSETSSTDDDVMNTSDCPKCRIIENRRRISGNEQQHGSQKSSVEHVGTREVRIDFQNFHKLLKRKTSRCKDDVEDT